MPEDKMKEVFIAGTRGTIKVKDRDGKIYVISEPRMIADLTPDDDVWGTGVVECEGGYY